MNHKGLIKELRLLGVFREGWSKDPDTYFQHSGGRVALSAARGFFYKAVSLAEQAAKALEEAEENKE